ncbi:hypothetical protein [Stenotrophomonas sp. 364]|uniref:hypothetical protein n=1 Tax=Stenotrophomonas sp. 364 TaxID=2691571 RepID=UPI0013198C1A|nr:hypothetical protein [Stenotrophomonas sp. 364]QHB70363.1 hypothetical protein GQ674_03075 [Stenotrophomonas sp. 364]
MTLDSTLAAWLEQALQSPLPDEVVGLSFNLSEGAAGDDAGFCIELVGTDRFDAQDPDWACDEVWAPEAREIELPYSVTGNHWEDCLAALHTALLQALATPRFGPRLSAQVQGIGLGFVDGDLQLLWQRGG